MRIRKFFTKEDQELIVRAIAEAENETSGEIRVHLAAKCKGDVLDSAAHVFKKLKMHKTESRNGVLLYLAIKDRKFAIIGDAGIHNKIPDGSWDNIKEQMSLHFSKGELITGLKEGILMIGEHLKEYFPILPENKNELPNDISFGK
jgi:uncharacterized membrane protein